MVDRVLIGDHPTFGMGAFVSVPTVDVKTAGKFDMAFSTIYEPMQIVSSGSTSVPGYPFGWSSTIVWSDLGYRPIILVSLNNHRVVVEYLSTASARIKIDQEFAWSDDGGTAYFVVLRSAKP